MTRPLVQFTLWRMIEAVAVVAVLLTAISFPPGGPAILGFAGAVAVHLVVLQSEHFQLGWVAGGFGLGGVIGIVFYWTVYPSAWVTREPVASTIFPAMAITLVLLGVHHARLKASRKKTRLDEFSLHR